MAPRAYAGFFCWLVGGGLTGLLSLLTTPQRKRSLSHPLAVIARSHELVTAGQHTSFSEYSCQRAVELELQSSAPIRGFAKGSRLVNGTRPTLMITRLVRSGPNSNVSAKQRSLQP